MAYVIDNVMEQRRVTGNTASAEIWIAYLHLLKAKCFMKNQEMLKDLQTATDAALDAFRKAQSLSSKSEQTNARVRAPF
jgi:hypothetical protein